MKRGFGKRKPTSIQALRTAQYIPTFCALHEARDLMRSHGMHGKEAHVDLLSTIPNLFSLLVTLYYNLCPHGCFF